jgi:dolichol-phosphate mannosyltransferase
MSKLISIIIPVFNEEKNIPLIYDELLKIFDDFKKKYDYEIIFIDDGSQDKSPEILENLTNQNNKVKYIQFSRNFGKEIAISAGIRNASGDAVISIDADLQHPPEFIPEFLDKWEKGAEIVVGIREKYDTIGIFRKFCNLLFYKLQNLISEIKIFSNETDYRLLDRKVVDEFNKFTERGRITRGLIDWLGFKKDYVYFRVKERRFINHAYNFPKLTKLAIATFISHSLLPLKLAGYLGVIITFFSGGLGLVILIDKYLLNDPLSWNVTGTATLAVLILFLVGIILCCLGFIALYIANIHNEVTNRPLYIIKKKKNFKQ